MRNKVFGGVPEESMPLWFRVFKAKLKHALYQISFCVSPSVTLPDFSFITLNQLSLPSLLLHPFYFHSFASVQASIQAQTSLRFSGDP